MGPKIQTEHKSSDDAMTKTVPSAVYKNTLLLGRLVSTDSARLAVASDFIGAGVTPQRTQNRVSGPEELTGHDH
jgi:hypothetical protein